MDLVARARGVPNQTSDPAQEITDLAIAWAKGEVSLAGVTRALDVQAPQAYINMARGLRPVVRDFYDDHQALLAWLRRAVAEGRLSVTNDEDARWLSEAIDR